MHRRGISVWLVYSTKSPLQNNFETFAWEFLVFQYDHRWISYLSKRLIDRVTASVSHVIRNGDPDFTYPGLFHHDLIHAVPFAGKIACQNQWNHIFKENSAFLKFFSLQICRFQVASICRLRTSKARVFWWRLRTSHCPLAGNGCLVHFLDLCIAFNSAEPIWGSYRAMSTHCSPVLHFSACTSASLEPSYVLRAIGADEDLAHSSIRCVA